MTVKFACAFAAFCAIVCSNIVFILCISALSHIECVWLINRALIEHFSLPLIIFNNYDWDCHVYNILMRTLL